MLALLGTRALLAHPDPPPSLAKRVTSAVRHNRARGLALSGLATYLNARLTDAGVRALPLKGPFLASHLYGDAGMRDTNDLDLLVAVEQLDVAVDVTRGIGYELVDEGPPLRRNGLPDLHHTLRSLDGRLTRVEIHWRIHWYEADFGGAMLAQSTVQDDGLLRPESADELAALLLFYARDGLFGLRAAADIAAWWDLYAHLCDAPALERHWRDYPALRRALMGAAIAAEAAVGVPAARLLPPARAETRTRLAAALARPSGEGPEDQLGANGELVDGLLAPPGGIPSFMRRHVFLSDDQIAAVYGHVRSPAATRRVLHPVKRCLRYAAGLWMARRALLPRAS
jgi:hypothetical protein